MLAEPQCIRSLHMNPNLELLHAIVLTSWARAAAACRAAFGGFGEVGALGHKAVLALLAAAGRCVSKTCLLAASTVLNRAALHTSWQQNWG